MWRRLLDIRDYLGGAGPQPVADWKPTVPDLTEAEKEAQRVKALAWFLSEMEGMKREIAVLRQIAEQNFWSPPSPAGHRQRLTGTVRPT